MALWACRKCGTRFAVGLSMCPQCTSEDIEDEMPKITTGGAHVGADVTPKPEVEQWPDQDGVLHPVETEEGDQSSVGTNSLTPTDSPQTETSEETTSKHKSAPTTESRSRKAQTDNSSARSTATGRKTDK